MHLQGLGELLDQRSELTDLGRQRRGGDLGLIHGQGVKTIHPARQFAEIMRDFAGCACELGNARLGRKSIGRVLAAIMADDHGQQQAEADGRGKTGFHMGDKIGQGGGRDGNRHHAQCDEE